MTQGQTEGIRRFGSGTGSRGLSVSGDLGATLGPAVTRLLTLSYSAPTAKHGPDGALSHRDLDNRGCDDTLTGAAPRVDYGWLHLIR